MVVRRVCLSHTVLVNKSIFVRCKVARISIRITATFTPPVWVRCPESRRKSLFLSHFGSPFASAFIAYKFWLNFNHWAIHRPCRFRCCWRWCSTYNVRIVLNRDGWPGLPWLLNTLYNGHGRWLFWRMCFYATTF